MGYQTRYDPAMSEYGKRQPKDGRQGIYMATWMNYEDLAQLDGLAKAWGLDRSKTVKRAIAEIHRDIAKFKKGPAAAPTRLKGKHRQPRRAKRLEG